MADNKKYYYIKLKDNYFDRDTVKLLEAQENGYIYSLIILKLYLKSARHNGQLMMTDRIPYSPERVDVLAKVINHDVSHVKEAIRSAVELDLIAILDSGEMWMTEIQNFIGQSSTEADRVREYRKKLQNGRKMLHSNDKSRTNVTSYKCTPELELELESAEGDDFPDELVDNFSDEQSDQEDQPAAAAEIRNQLKEIPFEVTLSASQVQTIENHLKGRKLPAEFLAFLGTKIRGKPNIRNPGGYFWKVLTNLGEYADLIDEFKSWVPPVEKIPPPNKCPTCGKPFSRMTVDRAECSFCGIFDYEAKTNSWVSDDF
ncbi:phage replisome organizer N-terminal domain-containing protein [Marispirochaeta aestuarii]|uniref:phage replisome organizer N-terminal domain-containing protein n=1 Tax=Marispirochaeta aestuarii TaxID=1963862 RepID=UPI002ABDDF65|nr:phage replisome organizer N-terminal domain-containing protein [Marispirochaeta aestuarii]